MIRKKNFFPIPPPFFFLKEKGINGNWKYDLLFCQFNW